MSKLVIFIINEMIRITANRVPIYSSYLSLRLFVIKIFFLFEKKLYFDYIQPILNTFISDIIIRHKDKADVKKKTF